MRQIDEEYTRRPFKGVPSMTSYLINDLGYSVNKKRIERLYKVMGLKAVAPGPHTSKPNKEHYIYPYLLKGMKIEEVNQVWETDITYIPMAKGFMYLMAVIDVYSRYVVGWSVSNTMDADWCVETIKECINTHGVPQIVNTDQGAQFTSHEFTGYLKSKDIKISMDGKGRALDNIFVERLWRTVKYEDIYLNAYDTGLDLHIGLIEYFNYYNQRRRHSSIGELRPADVYEKQQCPTTSDAKVIPCAEQCQGQASGAAAGATQPHP
ncbi:integrase [Persicobacter diffluens]|uniref:Integrase n=2 Tax=Persicobacter diffluens TaxID=981 RepID=A0AAN5AMY1_9BACT|nr:integrase [Persicobacter diffluens]